VDLVVYSLASPRRIHPKTAAVHKSVLKPVGAPYTNKTVDTDKGIVSTVTIEPASEQEIADTVAVMGGEDWELWMNALARPSCSPRAPSSVAYSYIGPEVTWAIYKNGTIGLAKNDLESGRKEHRFAPPAATAADAPSSRSTRPSSPRPARRSPSFPSTSRFSTR
jgi:enoyl-[acyl-carrier protein] reductase / trans-2-enoyl-CoA reductase (NAD+)